MKARDKARSFTAPSYRGMHDVEIKPGQENELAAASERFATTLRTASVESAPRESRYARFIGGSEHLLWSTTFESEWRRHIARANPSTIH